MNRFLTDLTSIYWWISVVIVGVLIHILSIQLTRRLDSRLSKASSWWRRRSERRVLKRTKEIAKLRASHHEQVMMMFQDIRFRIFALAFMLLSAFAFAISAYFTSKYTLNPRLNAVLAVILNVMGAFTLIVALSNWLTVLRIGIMIDEARKEDKAVTTAD